MQVAWARFCAHVVLNSLHRNLSWFASAWAQKRAHPTGYIRFLSISPRYAHCTAKIDHGHRIEKTTVVFGDGEEIIRA